MNKWSTKGWFVLKNPTILLATLNVASCPVGWGCRIYQLLLCRVVKKSNKCLGHDTKQSDSEFPGGMWSSFSLPLLPGSFGTRVVAPDRVLSMGQIERNCVLVLNWIAWNRIVLTFELHNAKLNCLKWNCFYMLNWIVWIRTIWLNCIAWNRNVFDN